MRISIKSILKKIPRYSKDFPTILYYKLLSLFYKDKNKYKDAWLIGERGIEAKDNGYVFFKFLRDNYPNKKVYYLIDSSQKKDYERVKNLGNLIEYNSFEHKMAVYFASHFISPHIGYMMPWSYLLFKKLFARSRIYVFLQHGVTLHDMSHHFPKILTGVDIFITATKNERDSIVINQKYGYQENEVILTGFARFDNLRNDKTKQQILFMPTWRSYLVNRDITKKNTESLKKTFKKSSYFTHLNSFLSNKKLAILLEKNDIELIFYPHFAVQKSLSFFTFNSDKIIVAKKEEYDVQQLLIESKIMITDYSSVAFDFAYMKKPLIYYQFDQYEYYGNHYSKGYFDCERDGFGAVVDNEEKLIDEIEKIIENNFEMEEKYKERVDDTFTYFDNKNCERIYNAIIEFKKN